MSIGPRLCVSLFGSVSSLSEPWMSFLLSVSVRILRCSLQNGLGVLGRDFVWVKLGRWARLGIIIPLVFCLEDDDNEGRREDGGDIGFRDRGTGVSIRCGE